MCSISNAWNITEERERISLGAIGHCIYTGDNDFNLQTGLNRWNGKDIREIRGM